MISLRVPNWIYSFFPDGISFPELESSIKSKISEGIKKLKCDSPDVSIIVPVWNEEKILSGLLYSLASIKTLLKTELIIVNNNSTDSTQEILDFFNVKNIFVKEQGISYARQAGLEAAKGKFILCADADTIYPENWIDELVKELDREDTVCVFGKYSFIPKYSKYRFSLILYEFLKSILIRIRRVNRPYLNVLGFNFGFKREFAMLTEGFKMINPRKGQNLETDREFSLASEDGMIAMRLMNFGKIRAVTSEKAKVWTSSRRLSLEGGTFRAMIKKVKLHSGRMKEYLNYNEESKNHSN